jgi:predicted PurR-regulated permease PerM
VLTEAHALLLEIAAADRQGIAAPAWLEYVPLAGPWLAERWQAELAHPGALSDWAQRMDATALLAWAQSLGQFMARHLLIVAFTILLLAYLYQEGESLAADFRRVLREWIGDRADSYADLSVRATRASVNSMLVVALFDGFACWAAFAAAGAPHAALWAAITGLLELVPFLGYAAVAALTLQLAAHGAAVPALVSSVLGSVILFCGDKIVRPLVARDAMRLSFVWILMGCLGGFEALGLAGLIIGPVVLTLAREMWQQRVHDIAPPGNGK